MIPKIIWQTHEVDRNKLPLFMQEISDTWINLNPGYEYVYMNADERREEVKKHYNDEKFLYQYDNLGGVLQADVWRYLVSYKYGGFYADMDSICITSLDIAIKLKYNGEDLVSMKKHPIPPSFCPNCGSKSAIVTRHEKFVNNANFGCIKESLIMKKILDETVDTVSEKIIQHLGPGVFSNRVLDNENMCAFFIDDVAIHDQNFKNDLFLLKPEYRFIVNYLGEKVYYHDLFIKK